MILLAELRGETPLLKGGGFQVIWSYFSTSGYAGGLWQLHQPSLSTDPPDLIMSDDDDDDDDDDAVVWRAEEVVWNRPQRQPQNL